jgi:hypothetical protein
MAIWMASIRIQLSALSVANVASIEAFNGPDPVGRRVERVERHEILAVDGACPDVACPDPVGDDVGSGIGPLVDEAGVGQAQIGEDLRGARPGSGITGGAALSWLYHKIDYNLQSSLKVDSRKSFRGSDRQDKPTP